MKSLKSVVAVCIFSGLASVAWGGVLGTSVTGSLKFATNPTNYFNSLNSFVPDGCLNTGMGSATVTVTDPTPEFCFSDNFNTDTVQITNNLLTITDVVRNSAGPFTMTFSFLPSLVSQVTKTSDLFTGSGLSFSFASDTLTVSFAGATDPGTLSASFALDATSTPEPATFSVLGSGLIGLAVLIRKKRQNSR